MNKIPSQVVIAISILKEYAVGDTIEDRFKAIITPERLNDACFMCGTEDEQFRSAVGALMMSYGQGTPEFTRIEAEMRVVNQVSMMLQASEIGMEAIPSFDDEHEFIGLMPLWRARRR